MTSMEAGPHLGEGVAKQKCGTCRYYQEAGLAGSGWCHHPQRNASGGHLLMVRRNELACRDGWSRNLWEPATGGPPEAGVPFDPSSPSGPLPPASADSLRAALHDSDSGATNPGEDVLLSEARIVSEPEQPWEPPSRAHPAGGFDPRTAIFRAREAYRDRVRAKAAEARQAGGAEAIVTHRPPESEPVSEPGPERNDRMGPDVDSARQEPERHAGPMVAPAERDLTRLPGATRPVRASVASVDGDRIAPERALWSDDASGWEQDTRGTEWADPDFEASMDEALAAELLSAPPASAEETPQRARQADDLPSWYRTDLPRICRACRDYRPSGEGQRGWCANAWAFTHRRLVQGDDVAPCHSAIGDWWVPVDDVWLVAADVSAHGRATPLLDRFVPEERAKRRRS
jgi:hypothetical protein